MDCVVRACGCGEACAAYGEGWIEFIGEYGG